MRRTTLVAALALAAFLTAPSTSFAGGFATVGLSSLPDDTPPGGTWVVDLTVLQHGRTPLEGVRPAVVIEPAGPGAAKRFPAEPTSKPGVYRAEVLFPSAGNWSYAADDGFGITHRLGTVKIGDVSAGADKAAPAAPKAAPTAAVPSADGGVSLIGALAIAAIVGLLAALAVEPIRRRLSAKAARAAAGRA